MDEFGAISFRPNSLLLAFLSLKTFIASTLLLLTLLTTHSLADLLCDGFGKFLISQRMSLVTIKRNAKMRSHLTKDIFTSFFLLGKKACPFPPPVSPYHASLLHNFHFLSADFLQQKKRKKKLIKTNPINLLSNRFRNNCKFFLYTFILISNNLSPMAFTLSAVCIRICFYNMDSVNWLGKCNLTCRIVTWLKVTLRFGMSGRP